jgi:hypothetical protein
MDVPPMNSRPPSKQSILKVDHLPITPPWEPTFNTWALIVNTEKEVYEYSPGVS